MPKSNVLNPASKPRLAPEAILNRVNEYFRGVVCDIKHDVLGYNVYLRINYADFLPRRVVRDAIEDIAPNCEVEEITRGYSDKYLFQAMKQCIECLEEIMVKLPDGTVVNSSVYALLEEKLQFRTLPANTNMEDETNEVDE